MNPREVAAGVAVGTLVGVALWPPGAVYWDGVAEDLGDGPTLVLVVVVAGGIGGTVGRLSGLRARGFAAGVGVAYVGGTVALEAAVGPDSPAHLVWYGVLAACLAGGAAAGALARARA